MSSKIVGVLLYPGCVYFEVARAVELLAERFQVLHFTPDGSVHAGADGVRIEPEGSYAALETTDVACVLVPGGDPDSIIPERKATAALNWAADNGALMAGICAGSLVLASAGLLRGKRATHNYTADDAPLEKVEATAPFWEGSVYERADVVEDANLVTAQHWAREKFAITIARQLGIVS